MKDNEKATKIKEVIAITLLPLPVIIYLLGRFILKMQAPGYLAIASGIILIVIILLLKIDVYVVRSEIKRRMSFSLTKRKKELQYEKNKNY